MRFIGSISDKGVKVGDWKAHVTLSLVGPATALLYQQEDQMRRTLFDEHNFRDLMISFEPDSHGFNEVIFDFVLTADTEEGAQMHAGRATWDVVPDYFGQLVIMESNIVILAIHVPFTT